MPPELAALSTPGTGPIVPNGPSERGRDDEMGRSGVQVGRSDSTVGRSCTSWALAVHCDASDREHAFVGADAARCRIGADAARCRVAIRHNRTLLAGCTKGWSGLTGASHDRW